MTIFLYGLRSSFVDSPTSRMWIAAKRTGFTLAAGRSPSLDAVSSTESVSRRQNGDGPLEG